MGARKLKTSQNYAMCLHTFSKAEVLRIENVVKAVKNHWNEETLKINFVFPLCRIANWQTDPDSDGDRATRIDVERYQPQKGRLDLLLVDNEIPRIVIECKKPEVTLVKNGAITNAGVMAMKQAHRYAQGVRFWRRGCLPNILSVIMNGKEIIWFDSSMVDFDNCFRTAKASLVTTDSIVDLLVNSKRSINHTINAY